MRTRAVDFTVHARVTVRSVAFTMRKDAGLGGVGRGEAGCGAGRHAGGRTGAGAVARGHPGAC